MTEIQTPDEGTEQEQVTPQADPETETPETPSEEVEAHGVLRPVIDAAVQTPSATWQPVLLLLDAGADRTVLDSTFLPLLAPLALAANETPELGGVGGRVDCIFIQSRLGFLRTDQKRVTVKGPFGVFTDPDSSDVSVLGRDVTNNFDVIYSYPRRQVTLLSPPDTFPI